MKNTRDELMEEYIRILTATDGKPRPMTEEEYKDLGRGVYTSSGETEWKPDTVFGGETEWKPEEAKEPELIEEEIESPPGWPKRVTLPDGSVEVLRSPDEWQKVVKEREEEKPSEPEYSDEEVLKMIKKDPSDVIVGLKLHRNPKYKKFMYPMLKAFVDWMTEIPEREKGKILYDEAKYMLKELESEVNLGVQEKI